MSKREEGWSYRRQEKWQGSWVHMGGEATGDHTGNGQDKVMKSWTEKYQKHFGAELPETS